MILGINQSLNQPDSKSFYFPNKSPKTMALLSLFSESAKLLPEEKSYTFAMLLSHGHQEFVDTIFSLHNKALKITQINSDLFFPTPLPRRKYEHILCGYEDWLRKKYSIPGFVEVEKGDIVIDCGAYVGGFSLSAARIASQVHLFEPDSINYACCVKNLGEFNNVFFNEAGLYNSSQTIAFHISESSVDHSILLPDHGQVKEIQQIEVKNLYDYVAEKGFEKIDFLKLEAEGVEPEIFEGLQDIHPEKLAIDVSPERDGQSPVEYFKDTLLGDGYEVEHRLNVLFARRCRPA